MIAKDTKIYKDTFVLAKTLFDYTRKFPKDIRPSIGRRIEETVLDLADLIVESNIDIDNRIEILMDFEIKYEKLQFVLELAVEQKVISLRQQAHLARLMAGIGKQAIGWKKSANKRKKSTGLRSSTDA